MHIVYKLNSFLIIILILSQSTIYVAQWCSNVRYFHYIKHMFNLLAPEFDI
jgi:hypothetical protein